MVHEIRLLYECMSDSTSRCYLLGICSCAFEFLICSLVLFIVFPSESQ